MHSRNLDVLKEIVFAILATAGFFAYTLLLLMLISFVFIHDIHITFEQMLVYSSVAAILGLMIYVPTRRKRLEKEADEETGKWADWHKEK